MTLQETLGAGAVLMTVGAGFALTQNQLDIRASKPTDVTSVASGAPASDPTTVAKPALAVSTRAGFVHTDALKLNYVGDGRYRSGFVIHNPHCVAEQVAMTLVLLDRNSEPLPVTAAFEVPGQTPAKRVGESWDIPPGHVQHVGLKLSIASSAGTPTAQDSPFRAMWRALKTEPFEQGNWKGRIPASGVLALALSTELTAPDKPSACKTAAPPVTGLRRPLVLEPPLPTALDTGVLSAALALALFTTLVVALIVYRSTTMQLRGRMGEVSFDFKNSLGANVTLGTAILAAVTSRAVLAQDQYSTSSTAYSILAIVLAALVPLGVALYSLLKPRVKTGETSTQAQGYVSMYLLSAAIVLWGAFGEILLLGMVFGELSLARVMSPAAAYLLILLTKVLIVALMAYAMMTAYATVKETSRPAVAGANTERPPAAVL